GHAVGCAVANASIDLFEAEPRLQQVKQLETALREGLFGLVSDDRVSDVRACGAVAAVELAEPFDIHAARQWFIDQGVFIRPLGRVVYLTPAYILTEAHQTHLIEAIHRFVQTQ
ncbi:MAG: aminotransferase class III-fold pyridoxal phosphate-dependent enzyme, partial [Pseudomonadota bacterium]